MDVFCSCSCHRPPDSEESCQFCGHPLGSPRAFYQCLVPGCEFVAYTVEAAEEHDRQHFPPSTPLVVYKCQATGCNVVNHDPETAYDHERIHFAPPHNA